MTWTFDDSLGTSRDRVRLELGDTSSADQQLSDEAIDMSLVQRSKVLSAAILCCDWVIAKYARLVSQGVGSVNVSYSDRLAHYQTLKANLRLRAGAGLPFVGGISVAGKTAADSDSDRSAPVFSVGMFDRKY